MEDEKKSRNQLIAEIKFLREENRRLNKKFSTYQPMENDIAGKTILIVDDNEDTRDIVTAMVEEFGYTTLVAESSQNAVELFTEQKTSIDLILSDIVMPDGGGLEMVDKIMKLQPGIKVIFMSGYAEDEIVHDEVFKIQNSCTEFIKKPFSMEEIGSLLNKHLGKQLFSTGE